MKIIINQKKRNGVIDLVKFMAAVIVLAVHIIEAGWGNFTYADTLGLVVELFFIISGFFLMKHLDNLPADTKEKTANYLLNKIKVFFAPLCIVNLGHFLLFCRLNNVDTVAAVAAELWHFKWEFLVLQCAGMIQNPQFNQDYLLGATWFLSAMMITLAVLYPLARYYRKFFVNIICPLSIIVIYAGFIKQYGTINVGSESMFIVPDALTRAFAGQCCGVLCYHAYDYIKNREALNSITFKIIDTVAWLMIPVMVVLAFCNVHDSSVFFIIPMGFIVISAMLKVTPVSCQLARVPLTVTDFLGKMSLYVYLTHYTVVCLVFLCMPIQSQAIGILLSVILTAVYSIMLYVFDRKRKSVKPVVAVCAVLLICSLVQTC